MVVIDLQRAVWWSHTLIGLFLAKLWESLWKISWSLYDKDEQIVDSWEELIRKNQEWTGKELKDFLH